VGKAPYWRTSEQQMIQVDTDGHVLGGEQAAALGGCSRTRSCLAALAERLAPGQRYQHGRTAAQVARYRDKIAAERAKLDEEASRTWTCP